MELDPQPPSPFDSSGRVDKMTVPVRWLGGVTVDGPSRPLTVTAASRSASATARSATIGWVCAGRTRVDRQGNLGRQPLDPARLQDTLREKQAELVKAEGACSALRQ